MPLRSVIWLKNAGLKRQQELDPLSGIQQKEFLIFFHFNPDEKSGEQQAREDCTLTFMTNIWTLISSFLHFITTTMALANRSSNFLNIYAKILNIQNSINLRPGYLQDNVSKDVCKRVWKKPSHVVRSVPAHCKSLFRLFSSCAHSTQSSTLLW